MARVDFSRKKGDYIFVIFSESWFLKLPDKGMESCETLKAMPKKKEKFLISGSVNYQPSASIYKQSSGTGIPSHVPA